MKIIYRTQKLKSKSAVGSSLSHAFRVSETPNADGSKQHLNQHVGAKNIKQARQNFNSRLPAKIRKNAVYAIEHLVTASPEWFKDKSIKEQNAFFSDALNFIKKEFGGDENMIYAGIHRDETTPHMYCYIVPIDGNGKLNSRHFIGGSKNRLSELQTKIAKEVGEIHGLERGQKKSRARHTTVREWYAQIEKVEKEIQNQKPIEIGFGDRLVALFGVKPKAIIDAERQKAAFISVYRKLQHEKTNAEKTIKNASAALDKQRAAESALNFSKSALARLKHEFKNQLEDKQSDLIQQLSDAREKESAAKEALQRMNEKLKELEPKARKWDLAIEKIEENKNNQGNNIKPG